MGKEKEKGKRTWVFPSSGGWGKIYPARTQVALLWVGWRRAGRSALVTVIARGMCLGPPATRPCEPGTTLVPSFCEYRAQRATEKWLRPATDMQ